MKMRKNAPRKWLHAILDLLPVILIPVFMIYSHRHTIEGNTAQIEENLKVDFNQYRGNIVASTRTVNGVDVASSSINHLLTLNGTPSSTGGRTSWYYFF